MNEFGFFPQLNIQIPYNYKVCFFYNKYNDLKDLGQSLGGYEFSSELMLVKCVHLVNIFTCNL